MVVTGVQLTLLLGLPTRHTIGYSMRTRARARARGAGTRRRFHTVEQEGKCRCLLSERLNARICV